MSLRAIRDTFAIEPISADTEVRRFVKAGTILLPQWQPEEEDAVVDDATARPLIIGNPAGSTPENKAPEHRRVKVAQK